MKVVRVICIVAMFVGVQTAFAVPPRSGKKETEKPATTCRAELLLDAATGEPLFELNPDEPLPPASMVKLMSAYVIYREIENGNVKWEDPVTVSTAASKMGGSQVFLKQGEQFTVRELLSAMLIQSANDAAMALAEHVGGSLEGFVQLMNDEAQRIGMRHSSFHFPHGLPPSKGQEPDLVSASDFGVLARELLSKYPEILELTKISDAPFRGGEFGMRNHNGLVRTYPGCDGLKTGFYDQAGFCVTATAQKNNQRMIAVVMGCPQRKQRDAEAARLLSMGFSQYRVQRLIEKGAALDARIPVQGGSEPEVSLVAGEELRVPVRLKEGATITQRATGCQPLVAPVAAGVECGTVGFYVGEREIGKVPAVTAQGVEKASILSRVMGMVKR